MYLTIAPAMKLSFIDNLLNRIPMYGMMLYFLFAQIVLAVILGFAGLLPFGGLDIIFSTVVLTIVSLIVNEILARMFKAPVNPQSTYITAWILALIVSPPTGSAQYLSSIGMLALVASIAMASKYLLAYRHKHIFNPAAAAVTITALGFGYYASWWAGNIYMLPLIILGGLLIVKKLQRWQMLAVFFASAMVLIYIRNASWADTILVLESLLFYSPIFFFAFVMLTEPLTAPLTHKNRLSYAFIIGLLFAWPLSIGNYYILPEMALLVGNLYAWTVGPKSRYTLKLLNKREVGTATEEFVFASNYPVAFKPGQYLEWTLPHHKPDLRGSRRFFSIASSPTEKELILTTKFYDKPSTFKRKLTSLQTGEVISASHQAGDFVLPDNKDEKLAFIAGGIGVAPFRSMVKYLMDKNEKRDIVLFYSCKTKAEAAYSDLFDSASLVGVKTVYVFSDQDGPLTAEKIKQAAPDFLERSFYLSGPHAMVNAFEQNLKDSGVPSKRIKIDFFPGYV